MKVVFFTDRDLGKMFPNILRDAGLTVECHADPFHDRRIRYKPNELAAVVRHNTALLVVIGAAPYPDLARSFVATAPKIVAFLETQARPFIAKVYRTSSSKASTSSPAVGQVQLWYPDPRP